MSRPFPYGVATTGSFESHIWTSSLNNAPDIQLREGSVGEVQRMLRTQQADAALLSPADLSEIRYPATILPAGCVSSTGLCRTLQVRSRVAPEDVQVLWADAEATLSIALARMIWMDQYDYSLHVIPFDPTRQELPEDADAVALSPDRLMSLPPQGYNCKLDLGEVWTEMTGLPLVQQLWVTLSENPLRPLYNLLETARKNGVANLVELAERYAPQHGWSDEQARVHLQQIVSFDFEDEHIDALEDFFQMAGEVGVLDRVEAIQYWTD